MKKTLLSVFVALSLFRFSPLTAQMVTPEMYFADYSRIKDANGVAKPFAKDPSVIEFGGRFLMYYSICGPSTNGSPGNTGWSMGIAESEDLISWKRIGEIVADPAYSFENKGICAPCAKVFNGKVHLFYQTYGNGTGDAICHAWSTDGKTFVRNKTNPIFRPTGAWTCGRAIDAEVFHYGNKYFLYFATRDVPYAKQITGVATAPDTTTTFNKSVWTQACTESILFPEYAWEGGTTNGCTEGASIIQRNGKLYMFYAGNYNNKPQQIGVAVSTDGLKWTKLSTTPFLANGATGTWNKSESGHPGIFDLDGQQSFLFYQGNNDGGKTWFLSQIEIFWNANGPSKVFTGIADVKDAQNLKISCQSKEIIIRGQVGVKTKLFLLDLSGREVYSAVLQEGSLNKINVSDLKNGVYLLRINDKKSVFSRKLIVK
jgi:predicted GH43/DUF377 family glycosyl hydrolase